MTEGLSSFGTLLKIGDGAQPENFTTIAELLDIDGITLKSNSEDGTTHSSPGKFVEKIMTTKEVGPIKFGIHFLPTHATHSASTGLIRDWNNQTKRNFQLVFPDPAHTTWLFSAYVQQIDIKAPVKGKLGADVTLEITGQPTLV